MPGCLYTRAIGRFGGCVGPWGLHLAAAPVRDYRLVGVTRFTHLKHFVRAKYNADYLLPLASIYWDAEPKSVSAYAQQQAFYDGTVLTRFRTEAYSVEVLSWYDAVDRDVAGFGSMCKGSAHRLP